MRIQKILLACCIGPLSVPALSFIFALAYLLFLSFQSGDFSQTVKSLPGLSIFLIYATIIAYIVTFLFGFPVLWLLIKLKFANLLTISLAALIPVTLMCLFNNPGIELWFIFSLYSVVVAMSCWFVLVGFKFSYRLVSVSQ